MAVDRWLVWAGSLTLVGYGGICLLLFLAQRSFIYFPQPAADPSDRLELRVEGRRVLAALFPDVALYLLHYRGYGGSEGSPSEAALRADAQAMHALVAERHSAVTVVGRSLGTGPAVHLALLVRQVPIP